MRCLSFLFTFAMLFLPGKALCAAKISTSDLEKQLTSAQGLCVQIGIDATLTEPLLSHDKLVLHCLDENPENVDWLKRKLANDRSRASVIAEHWTKKKLPHADNICNFVVILHPEAVNRDEVLRVLRPGGSAFFREGESYSHILKPWPTGMDSWNHQWHAAGGGLTTEDRFVGVPQGVQWLSGPLFAMAGRKSSTQSLVSANGINFYITQNVMENFGRKEMAQYLVARDAFNGLTLWQRPWTGPFVTGNGETNPRIVTSKDQLYIAGNDQIHALETRTGKLISQAPLSHPADKLALAGEILYVQSDNGITAFSKDLDSRLWQFREAKTSGMVIVGNRLLLLVSGRSSDGRFQHELLSLDPRTGKRNWRTDTQPQVAMARVRINFAEDGFAALQAHGSLHVYSSENGKHLWTKKTEARPGKSYVDERFVGHFYRHGLVWMLVENSPREPTGQNTWVGLNPSTGKTERKLTTKGTWPLTANPAKMGCQLLIASDRYIMIPRQATFIDFQSGEKLPFKFTRGGCGLGFVPANGLVYSHPHACGCFSEAIRGFMGMHSTAPPVFQSTGENRLTKGKVYGQVRVGKTEQSDWPMHRQSARRTAFSDTSVADASKLKWSVSITPDSQSPSRQGWKLRSGNVVSAPTVSGSTVFAANVDQGRVFALDVGTGSIKWTYTANGRVDSPPTLYGGLCLFGSHDGYVYCLKASSGELVWKFRAAPVDRRILAFGGVEATWPVTGTVLVQNAVAYVAAGRAPDADGGIQVHALDLLTGVPRWSKQVGGAGFKGLCDYLVGGNDVVFLSNWQFDVATGRNQPADEASEHLRGGKVGLLEASWTKHDLATRKDIQTWTANGQSGQIMAFSPGASVVYEAEEHQLDFRGDRSWSVKINEPAQLTSLALTPRQIVAAGGSDRADVNATGWLRVLDAEQGRELCSVSLLAEPVFDGIALADGRIFIATQDGQLHCFGRK